MSDIKNIEQHYSLDERPFLEKVRGFCQLVDERYSPYLTDFLNPREVQIVKDLANYYNLKFFVSSTFDNIKNYNCHYRSPQVSLASLMLLN